MQNLGARLRALPSKTIRLRRASWRPRPRVRAIARRGDVASAVLHRRSHRGEIRDVVDATGTVNAVTTVQVGSQVSGPIAKLNADFNSRVHRGDMIALIDPTLFHGALEQANADLESAKANVTAAEANLDKNRGDPGADQGRLRPLRTARREGLCHTHRRSITSQGELRRRQGESSTAAVAGVAQAQAQVKLKAAAVSVAHTNLDYTVIRSPIDGVVVARNVDVGQTVAASLQAPTIFTIAQDLTKMQLYAKTDESDVGRVQLRPGR